MTTSAQVMKRLKSLGNERNRITFARHEVDAELFGVPYADLYKLEKELGIDQALAEALWQTANHDARILAALLADPVKIKASTLDAWAKTIDNELTLYAVAGIAAKTAHARKRAEKWLAAKSEWLAAAGWHLTALVAKEPDGPYSDNEVGSLLDRIEKDIHGERNRVKHCMNFALISFSGRNQAVCKNCIAIAKRIGKVVVDHGKTSCKTPDAVPYIKKLVDRANAMAKRKAKKKAAKKPVTKRTATM